LTGLSTSIDTAGCSCKVADGLAGMLAFSLFASEIRLERLEIEARVPGL
jgi:hypothetical protein